MPKKVRLKTKIAKVISLKAEKEPNGRENRKKRLENTGFDASSCIGGNGFIGAKECVNAGGSTDVFHPVALVISGRPRVPIISAERIVVSQSQFCQFQRFRRSATLSMYQILKTPLRLSMFPVNNEGHQKFISLFIFVVIFFLPYWTIFNECRKFSEAAC